MGKLCLYEIRNWRRFEALVAAYFRSLPQIKGSAVKFVDVRSSGSGSDGGVDLIVQIFLHDGVKNIQRIYLVQCKFLNSDVGPGHMGGRSIKDLVTAHKACGYLLICKKMATNSLKEFFDSLTNDGNKLSYEIWSGDEFLFYLQKAPIALKRQFFPRSITKRKG
jgi:hypothetical protein